MRGDAELASLDVTGEPEIATSYTASIVIPVYNGARTLEVLLRSLISSERTGRLLIVVVCNGCEDDSADVARSFPSVVVVELDRPSKALALTAGEEVAGDVFPRFFVDADVVVEPTTIGALIEAANTEEPVAVAPSSTFDTEGKPWLVRSHFYGLTHLPRRAVWRASRVSGKGLYGTNRAGRMRFGAFPLIRADDKFFDSLFAPSERRVLQGVGARISVPESSVSLMRSQARVKYANRELDRLTNTRQPEGTTRGVPLRTRVRRTVAIWAASPVLSEFDALRTPPLVLGFYVVQTLVWGIVLFTVLTKRDVAWR
jgi:glycosyltransferase involved in cell wall biosynthesis